MNFELRFCLLLSLSAAASYAQDAEYFDDEFRAGLVATYQDSANHVVETVEARIAFAWGTHPPDRRLAGEAFSAQWEGFCMSQAPGEYQLSALVVGDVEIEWNGRRILDGSSDAPKWIESEPLQLEFDYHPIVVRYRKQSGVARLVLYWRGPQFSWEPLPSRFLYHDPEHTPRDVSARGAELVRALRCAGCHEIPGEPAVLPAPALDHLPNSLNREWFISHLQEQPHGAVERRRMPGYGVTEADARAISHYLYSEGSKPESTPRRDKSATEDHAGRKRRKKSKDQPVDPLAAGRLLLHTTGCLACHGLGDLQPDASYFSGGELTNIAHKRPKEFFRQWLLAPEKISADHRMPVFELTEQEVTQLSAFLSTLGIPPQPTGIEGGASEALYARGKTLVRELQCAACHRLPGHHPPAEKRSLDAAGLLARAGCLGEPQPGRRPGYNLSAPDRNSVAQFLVDISAESRPAVVTARQLMAEQNCLSCHARDGTRGLASRLPELAKLHDEFAPLLPAMTPPALYQVGDKMERKALQDAIRRAGGAYRDYLAIKMPRFRLTPEELDQIADWFIKTDRIPAEAAANTQPDRQFTPFAIQTAGRRLVTSDGFGCTSCHQIGSVLPVAAPLNARGPSLSMSGQRIRRAWFDRFVHNPARVTPALEMPSVRLAVRGVLNDDLDSQLEAVWQTLNRPGFEPPLPNPVRVVRHSGADLAQPAHALTDVVRLSGNPVVKPLLVGLANRHSLLFDLENAQLLRWSLGDVARQRTEGKTWYWEVAGEPVVKIERGQPEFSLSVAARELRPMKVGQFLTEIDSMGHAQGEFHFEHRLHFRESTARATVIRVRQVFRPLSGSRSGFRRRVMVNGLPPDSRLGLSAVRSTTAEFEIANGRRELRLADGAVRLRVIEPASAAWLPDGSLSVTGTQNANFEIEYTTDLPVDSFPASPPLAAAPAAAELEVVPGFEAMRLPFTVELMPTAVCWRPNGELVIASLKGRVWLARDTTGDGLEDQLTPFSDELPAPYGVAADGDHIDVLTKFGLLRMFDEDDDGSVDRSQVVASGWGHTDDYHDWAVGLEKDSNGNYLIALPCQQDDRTPAAAHLRGHVLRLVPRKPTPDNPRLFAIESVAAGLRFPMGLALRRDGQLFVSDNQGNYNPFNELNHIVAGRRYGFINKLERRPGFNPPLTAPAIDLPHPWTRSVNGMCFLDSPGQRAGHFGPFEGHLIGCEMDTRRLIRMTLQEVNGEIQGAAYPFSYNEPRGGKTWLGPLTCAVAPDGDLYVGGIHDSGWGGGNNIGEIARLRPRLSKLPCGIREVRATPNGLEISFTAQVDRTLAADPGNYSISSYTRTSTPAYGGDDEQRRKQVVDNVRVANDGRKVHVGVTRLSAGHVYEIHLKNLVRDGEFFPAEAHYTMRNVPQTPTPRDS